MASWSLHYYKSWVTFPGFVSSSGRQQEGWKSCTTDHISNDIVDCLLLPFSAISVLILVLLLEKKIFFLGKRVSCCSPDRFSVCIVFLWGFHPVGWVVSTLWSQEHRLSRQHHKDYKINVQPWEIKTERCNITVPGICANLLWHEKNRLPLDKCLKVQLHKRHSPASKAVDNPLPKRFLSVPLCCSSEAEMRLTYYHVCPRCVLWRHRQRGGNWGEWHAALQG